MSEIKLRSVPALKKEIIRLALAAAVYSVSGNWRWLFHLVEEKPWFRILRVPLTVLFGIGALLLDVMLLVHTGGTVQMQLVL